MSPNIFGLFQKAGGTLGNFQILGGGITITTRVRVWAVSVLEISDTTRSRVWYKCILT